MAFMANQYKRMNYKNSCGGFQQKLRSHAVSKAGSYLFINHTDAGGCQSGPQHIEREL
jgi:hypothetical protein